MLIAVFGLPTLSHEDDATRGVRTATETHSILSKAKIETHIGIATGTAFCGRVGSENRCEYSVVGDTVNLSARLMGAAAKQGEAILCDTATTTAASQSRVRLLFKPKEPIKLKGKEKPVNTLLLCFLFG